MLRGVEHGSFPQGSAVIPEPSSVNDFWNFVSTQEPGQEHLCRGGVAVALEQTIEHDAILVVRSPPPVANAVQTSSVSQRQR